MGEYKVSKDNCIAHLQNKMLNQLKLVQWGMNAKCLYDAMTFHHTYFCDGVDEALHEQIAKYLHDSGFQLEESETSKVWHFPSEPKGCLVKIYEAYRDSYETAVQKTTKWVINEVERFQSSTDRIAIVKCVSFLHKKCLERILKRQKKIHATTTLFDETFILYRRMTKGTKKLEWNAAGVAGRDFLARRFLCVSNLFNLLKIKADWENMMAYLEIEPNPEAEKLVYRFVYYVPCFLQGVIFNEIREHLVADVTSFPKCSENAYVALNAKGDDDVAVYFEMKEELPYDVSKFCSWRLRLLDENRRKES